TATGRAIHDDVCEPRMVVAPWACEPLAGPPLVRAADVEGAKGSPDCCSDGSAVSLLLVGCAVSVTPKSAPPESFESGFPAELLSNSMGSTTPATTSSTISTVGVTHRPVLRRCRGGCVGYCGEIGPDGGAACGGTACIVGYEP